MSAQQFRQGNCFKTQHYKVLHGQLVKVNSPNRCKVNYKYIPYSPLNKPMSQDYFRATIDELIKQNKQLKQIIQQNSHSIGLQNNYDTSMELEKTQKELNLIKEQLNLSQAQLQQQKALAQMREKQCKKLRQQNFELHDKINQLVKQMDWLKNKLQHTQEQTLKINSVLSRFDQTMNRLSLAQKIITQNTELSEALSRNQARKLEIQQRPHEQQFFSIQAHSFQREMLEERFMTPRQPKDHQQDHQLFKNRTVQQNKVVYSSVFSEKSEQDIRKSQSNASDSDLSNNINNWNLWAAPNLKLSSIQIIEEDIDPIAGSLCGMLSGK